MTRKLYKHKLLLDENFPPRRRFSKLNQLYDVKHIREDFGYVGLNDPPVHKVAIEQGRLVITFNDKDFRPLAEKSTKSGVVGISPNLTYSQLDTKLCAYLRKTSPKSLYGAFHYISGETRV